MTEVWSKSTANLQEVVYHFFPIILLFLHIFVVSTLGYGMIYSVWEYKVTTTNVQLLYYAEL